MLKSIQQIAVDYLFGFGSLKELKSSASWALENASDPHPDTDDLFRIPDEQAGSAAQKIAKEKYGFDPLSKDASQLALNIVVSKGRQLLEQTLPPHQFCDLVIAIYGQYADYIEAKWFSQIYDACDCCNEQWTLENAPRLPDDVEKMLGDIANSDL